MEWMEYLDGGHWFKSPQGIDDAAKFIRDKVPGVPSAGEGLSEKIGNGG